LRKHWRPRTEQGIIHRDLKPANIKVRPDGTVKVLDFGLAKLADTSKPGTSDLSLSPTITSPAMMTGVGVLPGTAAYMSPEQARGKAADRRSDIWAFGCVIYEMVTGRRAFSGNEVSDVLASVLAREPDWTLMPRAMSPALGTFIRHCLQKDRKDRIGDAQTIRLALEGAFESQKAAVTPKSPRARLVWAFAGLAMGMLVGAIALVVAARQPSTSVAETVFDGTD
jgi:serine/threonine protein kinase